MNIENATRCLGWTSSMIGVSMFACHGSGMPGSADGLEGQTSVALSTSDTGAADTEGEDRVGADTGTDDDGDGEEVETAETGSDPIGTTSTDGTDTTAGDGDDDSTGSPADAGDSVPCDVAEAVLEPVPPSIMLVLDKSGSMITNSWDHDDDPNTPEVTRWYSLYHVVEFIVTSFDAQIEFGANLFPSMQVQPPFTTYEETCVVADQPEVPVAPDNAMALLAGIPGPLSEDVHGGTPATAGFIVARDHLLGLASENPRAVVFIADGAANCMDGMTGVDVAWVYDENLPLVVGETWSDLGIPTYVVGIDIATTQTSSPGDPQGIVPWDVMNEVAEAGGRPLPGPEMFYQATNQVQLEDALHEIIDDALGCVVPLSPEPAFPQLLELYVDGTLVPPVEDCENEDGWIYVSPNGPYDEIELCGAWCDELKATGAATAEYHCIPG